MANLNPGSQTLSQSSTICCYFYHHSTISIQHLLSTEPLPGKGILYPFSQQRQWLEKTEVIQIPLFGNNDVLRLKVYGYNIDNVHV